jgi:magnesium chelatase family protein
MQKKRFHGKALYTNTDMTNKDIDLIGDISPKARQIAISATEKLHLSTRVYYRILRVARTIADIDKSPTVETKHVLEALAYRGGN